MHTLVAKDEERKVTVTVNMNSDFSGDMFLFIRRADNAAFEWEFSAEVFKSLVIQGIRYLDDETIIRAVKGNI